MDQEAVCWGIRTGEVTVSPFLSSDHETYTFIKNVKGKSRKITLHKVKLQVRIGNNVRLGKYLYRQDDEMSQAASIIYRHYYDRYLRSH